VHFFFFVFFCNSRLGRFVPIKLQPTVESNSSVIRSWGWSFFIVPITPTPSSAASSSSSSPPWRSILLPQSLFPSFPDTSPIFDNKKKGGGGFNLQGDDPLVLKDGILVVGVRNVEDVSLRIGLKDWWWRTSEDDGLGDLKDSLETTALFLDSGLVSSSTDIFFTVLGSGGGGQEGDGGGKGQC